MSFQHSFHQLLLILVRSLGIDGNREKVHDIHFFLKQLSDYQDLEDEN